VGLLVAVLVSWFGFSNRCALGLLLSVSQSTAVQDHCSKGAERKTEHAPTSKGSLDCCKSFDAVASLAAKALEENGGAFLQAVVFAAAVAIFVDPAAVPRLSDTGPPTALSFTELVLHRSLRSHAPPFCA
jgi:hypothetical protein